MSAASIAARRMVALALWEPRSPTAGDVVRRLTAMQAQEYAYAWWSIGQRTAGSAARSTVRRAFDEGRFLRTHVLRPTWHVVAPEDLRWLMALSGPRVMARNARRYRELGLDARTLARANDVIAVAVARSPLTRRELATTLERRRISTEGQRLSYLLMHAELEAVVCSGPMTGNQHTYAAFDARVSAGDGPRGAEALAALARRYFTTRGPATVRDFGWWSGLDAGDARAGLEGARAALESTTVDGRLYWFAGGGTATRSPRVDLVQCYDEAIISYRESRDVLGADAVAFAVPRRTDGFVHVILADGRLLGHWRALRSGGGTAVEIRLGRRLGRGERLALDEAVERYRRFAEG